MKNVRIADVSWISRIRTFFKQERYLFGEIHSEIFLADIKNMEI